ncbi:TPR domain protein [Daldinia caldariorum]|uniref:TPR domain protein n=1 Tax=Daldinia caldariorum TaxID=326644 RepID=UPI0020075CCE|nr:TPR domain protein [Daldinia caldariorum]KAI1464875.1 TPR domain protein [Daldinia caldariorum]
MVPSQRFHSLNNPSKKEEKKNTLFAMGDEPKEIRTSNVLNDYYNLGSYRRKAASNSEEAREWFNRGLIWSYAFNHEESAKCFERAIVSDNDCILAYWGLAYVLGPNYNKPWEFFDEDEFNSVMERANDVAKQARARVGNALPVEKALVDTLKYRYPQEEDSWDKDWPIWNQRYADAMEKVYKEFPDDLDVATLYVDALMNLTPWELWDIATGEPASGARTLEAKDILERAIAQPGGDRHPGLLHLYIHLMEMSTTPEAALDVANTLRDLVPDAGHLIHMPTHIDIILGDYQNAIESNQKAIIADDIFFSREDPLKFYTLYRVHNIHFRIYAAMFAGQLKTTLETITRLEQTLTDEILHVKSPPMADWMEGFLGMRVHGLIRFGRWQEIIDLPFHEDEELYCTTNALNHYAKGIALAATGRIDEASKQRELFAEVVKVVPDSRTVFNNKCVDILGVAEAMLDGELEYRRGNYDLAYSHLRVAIERSAALRYDEPWGWMQPPSHAYGALLVEQGHYDEAVEVYADDLGISGKLPRALQHPKNVWSLHGYHECLVKLGRIDEARAIKPQLDAAIAGADVPIKASCFCRTSVF